MVDIATLGLKFKLDGADKAKVMLDQLTSSAGQVAKAAVDSNGSFTDFAGTVAGIAGEAGPYGKLAEVAIRAGIEMHKGAEEQIAFRNALTLTGNFAGTTETALYAMSQSIAESSGVSAASVREIELQLVRTGQVGPGAMRELTEATVLYAKATGTDAASAVQMFTPLLGNTTSAALALNDQFHVLTYEQLKNVEALEKQGDKQAAVKAVMDALHPTLSNQSENLGFVEQAWQKVALSIAGARDELMSWGRSKAATGTLDRIDADIVSKLEERKVIADRLAHSKTFWGDVDLSRDKGQMAWAVREGMQNDIDAIDKKIEGLSGDRKAEEAKLKRANDQAALQQRLSRIMLEGQTELNDLKQKERDLDASIAAKLVKEADVHEKRLAIRKRVAELEKGQASAVAATSAAYAAQVPRIDALAEVLNRLKTAEERVAEQMEKDRIVISKAWRKGKLELDDYHDALDRLYSFTPKQETLAPRDLGPEIRPIDDAVPTIHMPTAEELDPMARTLEKMRDFGREVAGEIGTAVAYGRDLGDVLSNSFKRVAASYITEGIQSIFDAMGSSSKKGSRTGFAGAAGGGGDVWSTIFSGFSSLFSWDGGGYTGDGARSGGVDGKGGFLAVMHPRETVIDHTKGGGGGDGQNVNVSVSVTVDDEGRIQAYVRDSSVRAVQAGISRYDAGMPQRVAAIGNDPRRR
jgi:hypothetical protein